MISTFRRALLPKDHELSLRPCVNLKYVTIKHTGVMDLQKVTVIICMLHGLHTFIQWKVVLTATDVT